MPRLIVRLLGCPRFGANDPLLFPGAANLPTGKAGSEGRSGNSGISFRGLSFSVEYFRVKIWVKHWVHWNIANRRFLFHATIIPAMRDL